MKHWGPDPELIEMAVKARGFTELCLDIGGNHAFTFPESVTVGWEGEIKLDLSTDRLPFNDGEVDFVYCRHTLEDLTNPEHLLREIKRVARAGWLEIPSPCAELTRGVDAWGSHLGYCHHRWVGVGVANHLTLCAKYPVIERMVLPDYWQLLRQGGRHWNTFAVFDEAHPLAFEVLDNDRGFCLGMLDGRGQPREYRDVLVGMAEAFPLRKAREES